MSEQHTPQPTTPISTDERPTLTGDVTVEAVFYLEATVRVDVPAENAEEAAKAAALSLVKRHWDSTAMAAAGALRVDLDGVARSMSIYSRIGESDPEPLVRKESDDGGS